jgi:hypothetical protein
MGTKQESRKTPRPGHTQQHVRGAKFPILN